LIGRRRHRNDDQLASAKPSAVSLRDLLKQAIGGVGRRPVRTMLGAAAAVVGVGSVVAALGIVTTADDQVSAHFNLVKSTEVVVKDDSAQQGASAVPGSFGQFSVAAIQRLDRVNGVIAAGRVVSIPKIAVSSEPNSAPATLPSTTLTLLAADPGALPALGVHIEEGTPYDGFDGRTGQRVCVLGAAAAKKLDISWLGSQPAVWIADQAFTVVGIASSIAIQPQDDADIFIPTSTVLRTLAVGNGDHEQVYIQTEPGAARLIARQAPFVLVPQNPKYAQSVPPPEPPPNRSVTRNQYLLLALLGALALLIGGLSIANATTVAIFERSDELGLRRLLGAGHRHVRRQILMETSVIGLLAGIVGTSLGIVVSVVAGAIQQRSPTTNSWIYLLAPLLGLLIGFVAGLQPSRRAMKIEPMGTLRR
jgi:putative ABC transport system permease protein